MKRRKMGHHESRSHFSHHAAKMHRKNMPHSQRFVMRGGIRL